MKKYFADDRFESYPPDKWALLLRMILPMADHLEVCRSFAKSRLPTALRESEVALAAGLTRIYCATHRFRLTDETRDFVSAKAYSDWDTGNADECEDLALFKGNALLLGTISHEDVVVLLLTESEQHHINSLGFDFWCEWSPE